MSLSITTMAAGAFIAQKVKRAGWLAVLIAAVAMLPAGNARAEDRALLVGVGQYERQGPFPDIPGIGWDLEIMREVARVLGFEESQIRVLADAEATRDGIATAFDGWLIDAVGPEDRALFYFSGHGYQRADQDGDEPDGQDEIPHGGASATCSWSVSIALPISFLSIEMVTVKFRCPGRCP